MFFGGALKSNEQILLDALEKSEFSTIEVAVSSELDFLPTKVLVVVPFKDRADLTMDCIAGLFAQKLRPHQSMQLLLVDHESIDTETIRVLESMLAAPRLNHEGQVFQVKFEGEFNFSKIMNLGVGFAKQAQADLLFFLNNDIEFTTDLAMSRMMDILFCGIESLSRKKVGVVGLDLAYPDSTVQHVCAWPGSKIVATHPLKGSNQNSLDLWRRRSSRSVPAVTGAALMCRVKDFEAVGMFDERLPVLAQDIDLCLKFRDKGFSVAVLTDTRTIHKEGRTKRIKGFSLEQLQVFYSRWRDKPVYLKTAKGSLSNWSESPTFRFKFEPGYPWTWFASKR